MVKLAWALVHQRRGRGYTGWVLGRAGGGGWGFAILAKSKSKTMVRPFQKITKIGVEGWELRYIWTCRSWRGGMGMCMRGVPTLG